MTSKQAHDRDRARWRAPEAVTIALAGVVLTAAVGMVLSRPDVVIVGIVPALWLVHALRAMRTSPNARVEISVAEDAESSRPTVTVTGHADSDLVEFALVQGRTEPSQLITVPGEAVDATISLLHTGPSELVRVHARALSADGGIIGAVTEPVTKDWALEPVPQPLDGLPLSRRLVGMHGAHQGIRPGRGGDFRDIHPFAPGDEVRRIDWRVTARVARTPGELFIRRTNTLSDAEIVIVADTSADLGQNVSTWGTGDVVTSGATSLDATREATVSIAKAAIDVGDRVSFHELSPGGRIIPSAGGSRALVRLSVAMGTLGVRPPGDRTYRMPQVRPGSTVFVLSAFFHGPAAELANTMRAAGHRVIAIDTLPRSEQGGLSPAQRLAARTLFMERADVLADLRRTGVEVIAWGEEPASTSAHLVAAGRQR